MNKRLHSKIAKLVESDHDARLHIDADKLYSLKLDDWSDTALAGYHGYICGKIVTMHSGGCLIHAFDDIHIFDKGYWIPLACITKCDDLGATKSVGFNPETWIDSWGDKHTTDRVIITIEPFGTLFINDEPITRQQFSYIAKWGGWVYTNDPYRNSPDKKLPFQLFIDRDTGNIRCGCVKLSRAEFDQALDWIAKQWGYL